MLTTVDSPIVVLLDPPVLTGKVAEPATTVEEVMIDPEASAVVKMLDIRVVVTVSTIVPF